MQYTLLDLVQAVLSSIDADAVNSISDTVESMQVAQIVKACYDDIVNTAGLPEHYELYQLYASTACPVLMTKPSNVDEIEWIKYNVRTTTDTDDNWQPIEYLRPEDYLDYISQYDSSQSDVVTYQWPVNGNLITLYYMNDKAPQYFTSFDDETVFFDSYDSAMDANLQSVKTQCWGRMLQTFQLVDTFIPSLDSNLFPLLLAECKATAWAELKQTQNARAEKRARLGWVLLQKNKRDIVRGANFYENLPNYGKNFGNKNNDILKYGKRNW